MELNRNLSRLFFLSLILGIGSGVIYLYGKSGNPALFETETPSASDQIQETEDGGSPAVFDSRNDPADDLGDDREGNERTEGNIFGNPISQSVPFTSQAPSGEWDNPIFQDGCEEASIIMAMAWVNGEKLTSEGAKKKIEDLAAFQNDKYGEFRDSSAQDTARLIVDYYGYGNIEVMTDIGSRDIRNQIEKGNVVIVPMDGRKLGNPFFTPPGPLNHMLVVVGYDPEKREFITNDPGTRRGEGFRYAEKILEDAIRDYPTGYHEPNPTIKKALISVSPSD